MPIYTIACAECGAQEDVFRPISRYNDLPNHCGKPMHRVVTAPYVAADIQPYKSMATGEWITSRSKHREHLKANRLIEIGNEVKHVSQSKPLAPPPGLKKRIAEVVNSKL